MARELMNDEPSGDGTPSRIIAVLLNLIGPIGTGQFYFGRKKRGACWLGVTAGAAVVLSFALPALGALVGYGKAFAFVVACLLGSLVASVVDVLSMPASRIRRTPARSVAGFFAIGCVLGLGLRFVVHTYALNAFQIPSGSMQPTLLVNEHIMAERQTLRARTPRRGELVVFSLPEHPEQDFIKRVIALPGDTLQLKSGHPWLNGWEVPHCLLGKTALPDARPGCEGNVELEFLEDATYLTFFDACSEDGKQGPYAAAPGEVWVLGDNRNNSYDSRAWSGGHGGGLPFDNVLGLALFRWFSPSEWSRDGTAMSVPLLPQSMAALRPEFERCLARRPPREKTVPPSSR